MSQRDIQRSVRKDMGHVFKPTLTCPGCGSTTRLTNAGFLHRHRMPPMNFGYNMPSRAGPVCAWSGRRPAT